MAQLPPSQKFFVLPKYLASPPKKYHQTLRTRPNPPSCFQAHWQWSSHQRRLQWLGLWPWVWPKDGSLWQSESGSGREAVKGRRVTEQSKQQWQSWCFFLTVSHLEAHTVHLSLTGHFNFGHLVKSNVLFFSISLLFYFLPCKKFEDQANILLFLKILPTL